MQIRNAEIKDAAVLDELLTRLIRYESRWDPNLDEEYTVRDNYSNMIGHQDCKILIAEEDGEIWGFLCAIVCRFPMYRKPMVILDALYVEEQYRNRGCATALIQELQRFAVGEGAASIELKVFSENATANKLYSRHGFAETKKYLRLDLAGAQE